MFAAQPLQYLSLSGSGDGPTKSAASRPATKIVTRGRAGVLGHRRLYVWPFVSSAHASTATATASLYFLSAWYCSALPPRCIFLHICLWPRRQWSCWQVLLQYLV